MFQFIIIISLCIMLGNSIQFSLSLSLSIYIYIYSFYVNCEDDKLWFLMFLTQWHVSSSSSSICALCCGIVTNFIFLWHLSFCPHCDTIKFKLYINYMLLCLMSSYHTIWLSLFCHSNLSSFSNGGSIKFYLHRLQ